ncbi:MAG: D-2-hydroxyacid dehydrogenase, partial [Candidatus Bathyarchaeia archaeon]
MSVKVLICDPIDDEGIQKLKSEGFEVNVNPSISKEELEKIIPQYEVLIVRSRTKVTKEIIDRGKRLKVIGRAGAGLDNINLEAAEKRGINVLNTPEAAADSVAELTIGLMLALARKIAFADRTMKEGKWLKKELEGSLLKGKTLGLIGLGNIGVRVAKLAKAFGMKILITKRNPLSHEMLEILEAKFVSLQELLKQSDIVSIHIPLNQQTTHMIGANELNLMKKGSFLINTSRGAIVDEKALFDALATGKLGGAALDVYEHEPPTDLRLVKLPNV